jgi:hypothetical protein
MITVQKHAKIFKQFQSLTMTTYLELGIPDIENTVRRVNKCPDTGGGHFEHYL